MHRFGCLIVQTVAGGSRYLTPGDLCLSGSGCHFRDLHDPRYRPYTLHLRISAKMLDTINRPVCAHHIVVIPSGGQSGLSKDVVFPLSISVTYFHDPFAVIL